MPTSDRFFIIKVSSDGVNPTPQPIWRDKYAEMTQKNVREALFCTIRQQGRYVEMIEGDIAAMPGVYPSSGSVSSGAVRLEQMGDERSAEEIAGVVPTSVLPASEHLGDDAKHIKQPSSDPTLFMTSRAVGRGISALLRPSTQTINPEYHQQEHYHQCDDTPLNVRLHPCQEGKLTALT